MNENAIGTIEVDYAVELRRDLGPGLLEAVYEGNLARALERRGLRVQRQVGVGLQEERLAIEPLRPNYLELVHKLCTVEMP